MNQQKQLLIEIKTTNNLLLKEKEALRYHQIYLGRFIHQYRIAIAVTSIFVLLSSKKIT